MAREGNPTAVRALRRLRTRNEGGLESTGAGAPNLSDTRIQDSLEIARERFRKITERANTGEPLNTTQAKVLEDAEAALRRLAAEGETADITKAQQVALEAIIITDGTRPSLFVKGDQVDPASPQAGVWQVPIGQQSEHITTVAESVGRINSLIGPPHYAGTGFVVGDGLILTNRHVLEELVGGPDPQPSGTWRFLKDVTIDFLAEFGSTTTKSFKVTGVKFASLDRIKKQLVLKNLDVALLTVETHNGTDPLPPPLSLSNRMDHLKARADLYVMGYPAKPYNEVAKVLMAIFQDEYFVKRFAPGYVDATPTDVSGGLDPRLHPRRVHARRQLGVVCRRISSRRPCGCRTPLRGDQARGELRTLDRWHRASADRPWGGGVEFVVGNAVPPPLTDRKALAIAKSIEGSRLQFADAFRSGQAGRATVLEFEAIVTGTKDYTEAYPIAFKRAHTDGWIDGLWSACLTAEIVNEDFLKAVATVVGKDRVAQLQQLVDIQRGIQEAGLLESRLPRALAQVCRVEINGDAKGTGFLIRADLVMTAYHVVQPLLDAQNVALAGSAKQLMVRFDYKKKENADRSVVLEPGFVCRVADPWLVKLSLSLLKTRSGSARSVPSVQTIRPRLGFVASRVRRRDLE